MGEVFLEFRTTPVESAKEVRSTLIMAALQSVRAKGLFQRYLEALDPSPREQIIGLVAGVWAPIEVAVAHYESMDRLGIDHGTIEAMGAEVASRTWKHSLAPIYASASRGAGAWEILGLAHQTTARNWRGSDVRIIKEGPTQALYEWVGQPCAKVPYFVSSFAAFMRAQLQLFSQRAYTRIQPDACSPTRIAIRLSWTEPVRSLAPTARGAQK